MRLLGYVALFVKYTHSLYNIRQCIIVFKYQKLRIKTITNGWFYMNTGWAKVMEWKYPVDIEINNKGVWNVAGAIEAAPSL